MPDIEGSLRTGWLVWCTDDEVDLITDSIAGVGVVSSLIPEPGASKALAATAGLIAIVAKRAKAKNLSLGVYASVNPMTRYHVRKIPIWLRATTQITPIGSIPFYYSEDEFGVKDKWRYRFGV
jgi:hypothetical protein